MSDNEAPLCMSCKSRSWIKQQQKVPPHDTYLICCGCGSVRKDAPVIEMAPSRPAVMEIQGDH